MKAIRIALCVASLGLLASGCTPRYAITSRLSEPLDRKTCVRIAPIQDALPSTMEATKKPSAEDMGKFQAYLAEEIGKRRRLGFATGPDSTCGYEVQATLMEYKKGSGAARYFIGFGAGKAKVTTVLKLVDVHSGNTLFAGNFTGEVSGGFFGGKGDAMFRLVARDFAKELEKEAPELAAR